MRIPHSPDQVLVKMGRGAATSQSQCHFEAWQGFVRLQIQCGREIEVAQGPALQDKEEIAVRMVDLE